MRPDIFAKISRFFRGEGTPYQHPEKEDDSVKHTPKTEEFERCVMCGGPTGIPVSMPIDQRENYEIGCGQLCVSCKLKLRGAEERDNDRAREQLMRTIEQSKKEQES